MSTFTGGKMGEKALGTQYLRLQRGTEEGLMIRSGIGWPLLRPLIGER